MAPPAFPLPWSHYVRLMSVKNANACRFYEAEALRCGWTWPRLDRQIAAIFYERTALSKNKVAMMTKGARPDPKTTRELEDFKMAASFFRLTPEHLGQTFRDEHGPRFRLVGLNMKSRKRPFIVAGVTWKQYTTSEEVILRGFGIEPRKA